jgi:hypothetical protein
MNNLNVEIDRWRRSNGNTKGRVVVEYIGTTANTILIRSKCKTKVTAMCHNE